MHIGIQIADVVAGVSVLLALAMKFKYRWIWVLYMLACWTYMVLNFYTRLPAQGTMNLVAGGIAAWHAATWKEDDEHR